MTVTIHQPDFIPWLGFFDRWAESDLYIILDDVQFIRHGWTHRDRIKTPNGPLWLTVPVCKKGNFAQLIKDTKIDDSTDWRLRHLRTIKFNYAKAPNFISCFPNIEKIYKKRHNFLIDLNMDFLHFLADRLNINKPCRFASDFKIKTKSSQRLVDLADAAGADVYLTGVGSNDYLDESIFAAKQIKVKWQDYVHPVYEQLHGKFLPMLSALDYIMMEVDFDN